MKSNIVTRMTAIVLSFLLVLTSVPLCVSATEVSSVVGWDGTVADSFDGGSGTWDDPYLIVNGAQLALLAANVNAGQLYEQVYFELGADIVLNDTTDWTSWGETDDSGLITAPINTWTPIGRNYWSSFCGSFDGAGYTVYGVYANTVSSYSGLFGYNRGSVHHVTVAQSYIGSTSYDYVGGIVGYNNGGTVYDCIFDGVAGGNDVGGIVGCNYDGTVMDCVNNGSLHADDQIGGIVCANNKGIEQASVIRCVNNAAIADDTASYIGGIVCDNNGIVSDCTNEGAIIASCRGASIGGVAYENSGDMTRCINRGALQVASEGTVGGLVSRIDSVMSLCVNYASVSGAGDLGGLAAEIQDGTAISDCYNLGALDGSASTYRNDCVGGLFGYSYAQDVTALSDCYTVGTVTAGANCRYAGAVLGRDYRGAGVTSCYYLDTVIAQSNDFGTALTDEQLQTADSFVGWNFNRVWELGYDDAYVYPTLRCFGSQTYYYEVTLIHEGTLYQQYLVEGGKELVLPIPSCEGLEFAYWESADGSRYQDTLYPHEDTVLTAIWTVPTGSEDAWDGTYDTDWAGSGTEEDPYRITSAEELAGLAQNVNSNKYSDGTHYQDTFFKLTTDIVLNDGGGQFSDTVMGAQMWTPIGAYNDYYGRFWGTFDGDGHTVSGLYCDRSYFQSSGLFGFLKGTVKNLTIADSYICGTGYVGAVAGQNEGTVDNVTVCATVVGEAYTERVAYVGGAVGYNAGVITQVTTQGAVSNNEAVTYLGGVAGRNGGEMSYCTNCAAVTAEDVQYVGGVVGDQFNGTMTACVNEGAVSLTHAPIDNYSQIYLGGVAGYHVDASMYACLNEGVVTAKVADSDVYVGGLVGAMAGQDADSVVHASYNLGYVRGTNSKSDLYIGGLVGYMYDDTFLTDSYSLASVSGNAQSVYGGGVVGRAAQQAISQNCYYIDSAVDTPNDYGVAASDEALRERTTYENWNFYADWEMGYDTAFAYPTPIALGSQQYFYRVLLQNGDNIVSDAYYAAGTQLTLSALSDTQYLFDHWEDQDGNTYTADTVLTVESDITLRANWVVKRTSDEAWDGTYDTNWAGSGTEDDPYLITCAEELAGVAYQVNHGVWMGSDVYYKLTTDILLGDGGASFSDTLGAAYEWEPIGLSNNTGFSGHFDGDGHTVSGLYTKIVGEAAGLFGYGYGTVKNLHLTDSYISLSSTGYSGYVGGIAGHMSDIDGCSSAATVVGRGSNNLAVGGVVGMCINGEGSMTDCINTGTVSATGDYVFVGGVAGECWAVENCQNKGAIKADGDRLYVGGIIGAYSARLIANSKNEGAITVQADIPTVGGVASGVSTAERCENSGAITVNSIGSANVGGVIGDAGYDGTVTDLVNYGAVTVYGDAYVGGVVSNSSVVRSCENNGTLTVNKASTVRLGGVAAQAQTSVEKAINNGTVTVTADDGVYLGGVVGSGYATVSDSANCGDIRAQGEAAYVGGVISWVESPLTGCYSSADLTVYGKWVYVGGVAGYASQEIRDCYAVGTLCAERSEDGSLRLAGLAGITNASVSSSYAATTLVSSSENAILDAVANEEYENLVSDCYYLQADELFTASSAVKLTEEQMTAAASFAGFDFETAWTIGETAGYVYPTLQATAHRVYCKVEFVVGDAVVETQRLLYGEAPTVPDLSEYLYDDAEYVYRFDHWNHVPSAVYEDTTVTAVFEKVEKQRLEGIDLHLTVENGYSADNLLVDLEAMYSRLVCSTTTGYRLLSDAVWELDGYDATAADEYVLTGTLLLTDSMYYTMADGATVTVTVTVLDAEDVSNEFDETQLSYTLLDDGTIAVTGYSGTAERVYIPQMLGGKTVTAIADEAFANCETLVSMVLPDTLTTVGNRAFENCTALAQIVLPEGVQTVGNRAFYNTALASVTCPVSLAEIGQFAFGFYSETETVDGFAVYTFADQAAAVYAAENDLLCVTTTVQTDEMTAIEAVTEDDVTLAVVSVTQGDHFEAAQSILENTDAVTMFDISLYDIKQEAVQPGHMMTVSIPVPDGYDAEDCRIYRVNDDGSYMDMQATLVNGRLVFHTAHLSHYAIIDEGSVALLGDVTGDGIRDMFDAFMLYACVSGAGALTDAQKAVAEMTGDGVIDMFDAMKLYMIVAGM